MNDITFTYILLANAIVIAGAVVQGSIGIGFALVSAPFLILISQVFIPGPLILSGLFLSILVITRERRSVDFFGLKLAILGRIIGTVLGALILLVISKAIFNYIFGVIIIVAALICISGISLTATGYKLFGAGLLSGIMSITASVGGPPMGLIYQNKPGATIRATLAGFFIVGTVLSLSGLIIIGRFGREEINAFVTIIPGLVLGFILSKHSLKIIDRGYTKKAILFVVLLSGITVILRGLY